MKKLVIFHPAIAPYRVDLFNSLYNNFKATFYFSYKNALEQTFHQEKLVSRLNFEPHFLSKGVLGLRNLRLEVIPILKKQQPDIVLCSEFNLIGLFVLVYKLIYNRNLRIYTLCDDSRNIAENVKGNRKYVRDICFHFFDGVISANLEVNNWYKENDFPIEKTFFFPIVQNDKIFRSYLSESLSLSNRLIEKHNLRNKKAFYYVGRLVPIKNLTILVEAFYNIALCLSDVVLIIIGEGEEYTNLKKKIIEYKLEEKVIFTGKKQGEELYAWFNIGQIFILPSYKEPFGAVVNEALLSGSYVICSSEAGATSLIEPYVNGTVFSPFNIEELTQQLKIAYEKHTTIQTIQLKPNNMQHTYNYYWEKLLVYLNK